jgi:hypothetical protein
MVVQNQVYWVMGREQVPWQFQHYENYFQKCWNFQKKNSKILGLKEQNFVKENNGILKNIFFNENFQN